MHPTEVWPPGHWDLQCEAGAGDWEGGAPLAYGQGSGDPRQEWVVGAPVEFSVRTRPGRGRSLSRAARPLSGPCEAGVQGGGWPVVSGSGRKGGLSRTPVLQSPPSPGSWSGGWQWGCSRQISCLCVFATPFYKGKHNLKYDYLVLQQPPRSTLCRDHYQRLILTCKEYYANCLLAPPGSLLPGWAWGRGPVPPGGR